MLSSSMPVTQAAKVDAASGRYLHWVAKCRTLAMWYKKVAFLEQTIG